jgi:uncharacterized protein (TIGR02118 family)
MYTVLYVIYRKEGISREQFTRHWVDVHAPLAEKLPHVRSYTIYPVTSATDVEGQEVDGFALLEFDSQAAFEAAAASPEMAAAGEDAALFARHFAVYSLDQHSVI